MAAAAVSPGPGGVIDLGLRGSVIVVTGDGSGIGAAAARQLGASGARVVLVGRRAELLRRTAGELDRNGSQALCVPADLTAADSRGCPRTRRRRRMPPPQRHATSSAFRPATFPP